MNTTTLSIKDQIAQIAATIEALQIQKIQLETQLAIEEAVATKQQAPNQAAVDAGDEYPLMTGEQLQAYAKQQIEMDKAASKRITEKRQAYYEKQQQEPEVEEKWDTSHYSEQQQATIKKNTASRVKRSKQVDTIVEKVKGKRDINAGDKARIDATKKAAQSVRPEKVAQEKRTTKKAEKATTQKQPKRNYNGMTYAQVRSEVSTRKAALNKADQERMAKAGLRNNTWDGAIASLEWLNKYFAK